MCKQQVRWRRGRMRSSIASAPCVRHVTIRTSNNPEVHTLHVHLFTEILTTNMCTICTNEENKQESTARIVMYSNSLARAHLHKQIPKQSGPNKSCVSNTTIKNVSTSTGPTFGDTEMRTLHRCNNSCTLCAWHVMTPDTTKVKHIPT